MYSLKSKILDKKVFYSLSDFLKLLSVEKTGLYTNITEKVLSNSDFLKLSYDLIENKKGNVHTDSKKLTIGWFKKMAQNIKNNALKFNTKYNTVVQKKKSISKISVIISSWHEKTIQKAVHLILEEIYKNRDITFAEFSYTFYSNKSLHSVFWIIKHKWILINWFVKVDIKNTFNSNNYFILISKLKLKIRDIRLNNIILRMFKANIISMFGILKKNISILQSSILSQVLTNVYFQGLDCKIKKDFMLRYNVVIKSKRSKEKTLPILVYNKITWVYYIRYVDDFFVGVVGCKRLATKILNNMSKYLKSNLNLFLNKEKSKILSSLSNKVSFLSMLFYNVCFEERFNRKNCKIITKKKVCTRIINCIDVFKWRQTKNFRKIWLYWIAEAYDKYCYNRVIVKKDFKSLTENLHIFESLFFKRNRSFYKDFLKKLQEIIEKKQNKQLCFFFKRCEEKCLDFNKNSFTNILRPILKYEIIERIVILLKTNHNIPAYTISWYVLFKGTSIEQAVFKPIWPEDFELSKTTIFKLQKLRERKFTGRINKQAIYLAIKDWLNITKNLNIQKMVSFKLYKSMFFFFNSVDGGKIFPIRVSANIDEIYRHLIKASILNENKKPIRKTSIVKFNSFLIIFYFKKVASDLLSYFRCTDNFYNLKNVINYFIRYSLLHTLAHKHKCSLRIILFTYGQEIKIEDTKNYSTSFFSLVIVSNLSKNFLKKNFKEDTRVNSNVFFKYLSKCLEKGVIKKL